MSNKSYYSDFIHAKLPGVASMTCLGILVIIIRLAYLQLYYGSNFLELSKKNYERTEEVVSIRGDILDCNGNALATNRPITNVYWQGTGNLSLQKEQIAVLKQIETTVHGSFSHTSILGSVSYVEKTQKKYLLVEDISMAQLSAILEHHGNHPNILVETNFKRFYPHKTVASHILGYIGQIENTTGKMGLEKMLDALLRGNSGRNRITINSLGTPLLIEEIERAFAGAHIKTTLDLSLQTVAEELFPENTTGAFIIMDPKNGALKVVLSRPHFDPNLFVNPIDDNEWQKIQDKKPFINRAFNASYPPASIFKLVTAAAALEEGIVTQEDVHECTGHITFGNRRYYCMRRSGHGVITTKEALALSCNPLFYTVGQRVSVDVLAHYANRFGLGIPTELLLPEKTGLIPTVAWKREMYSERWWPGETLSVAIGQSYLLCTPIQITCMISSIFEGYLVRPRILMSEQVIMRPLEISQETQTFLQDSMRLVVTQGTGQHVSTINDISIWAKTGTGQTSDRLRRKIGKKYGEYAWFVGYFHYKDYDPLTMVILLEQATSSVEATSLAKQFLMQYRTIIQQRETSIEKNSSQI